MAIYLALVLEREPDTTICIWQKLRQARVWESFIVEKGEAQGVPCLEAVSEGGWRLAHCCWPGILCDRLGVCTWFSLVSPKVASRHRS